MHAPLHVVACSAIPPAGRLGNYDATTTTAAAAATTTTTTATATPRAADRPRLKDEGGEPLSDHATYVARNSAYLPRESTQQVLCS